MSVTSQLTHKEISQKSLGRFWVAILHDQVVGIIAKATPRHKSIDKKQYKQKAISCLSILGKVKSGDLLIIDGVKYFAKKLTHRLRISEEHDQTRTRKLYHIAPWVLSGLGSPNQKPKKVQVAIPSTA